MKSTSKSVTPSGANNIIHILILYILLPIMVTHNLIAVRKRQEGLQVLPPKIHSFVSSSQAPSLSS